SFDYIPYCRTWNDAAWRARPGRIMRKVLEFRPSIVCLQEVDMDLYEAFFRKELESLGYAGAYCQRSGRKSDGCATFVLRQQAALVKEEGVAYKVQGHPVLDRDNVALLVIVDVLLPDHDTPRSAARTGAHGAAASGSTSPLPRSAEGGGGPVGSPHRAPSPPKGRAGRLVVANTHLVFNPKRGDIKTAQLMMLTGQVERWAKRGRGGGGGG
ncbi:unnamed protein product, partial [Ectocarpus sp. 12 AP-2014]